MGIVYAWTSVLHTYYPVYVTFVFYMPYPAAKKPRIPLCEHAAEFMRSIIFVRASAPVGEVPVAWQRALILHGLAGIGLQQWKRGAASIVLSYMRCATTDAAPRIVLCCVTWFITYGRVWIGGWGQFGNRKCFFVFHEDKKRNECHTSYCVVWHDLLPTGACG